MKRPFAKEMQAQKDRARKARGGEGYMGAAVTVYDELPTDLETKFAGYDVDTVADAKIVALVANDAVADGAQAEDSVVVFLDRTPSTQKAAVRLAIMVSLKPQTA